MGRICTFQNRNDIRYVIFMFGPNQLMQAGRFISIILIYFAPVNVEVQFKFKIFLVYKTLSRCQLSRHYCWKTFKVSWIWKVGISNMWINIYRKYKSHCHSSFYHSLLTVYHSIQNIYKWFDWLTNRTCWPRSIYNCTELTKTKVSNLRSK